MPNPISALLVLALALPACASTSADGPLREGRTVYGNVCSACHGDAGQGGVGPALDNVTATFPSCDDHIEWVSLGSEKWKETYGDTYGANASPVEGAMPGHSETLTNSEIALVAAFERTRYGGVDEETAMDQCNIGP
jgi:mono/diheme cytochrome c family protein